MACAQTRSGETAAFGLQIIHNFKQKINNSYGSYNGIAITVVGMLSTLCVTLATDNAGGIAETAGLDQYVTNTTDGFDGLDGSYVLGNTAAATGAVLTALAPLAPLAPLAAFKNDAGLNTIDISSAEILVAVICLGTGDMGYEGD